jgi:steroid delta-isomerase
MSAPDCLQREASCAQHEAVPTTASHGADLHVARIVEFFEGLKPADLQRLPDFYCADARFKDPFNDVQGTPAIVAVFAHMYRSLDAPRFVVHNAVAGTDECFLTWDFMFRFKRMRPAVDRVVHGATHLRFAPDGRIALHRDYWDAAEELYEKLPLIGALMRWLRSRASA